MEREPKYTREDVIITREQAEMAGLKKGMACYLSNLPSNCVFSANRGIDGFITADILEDINWDRESPFKDSSQGTWWDCVIIRKKPEKKFVPFDFSLEEDRDALMGKRIRNDEIDLLVTSFMHCLVFPDKKVKWTAGNWDGDRLFEQFTFAEGPNKGKPVGKEIEE